MSSACRYDDDRHRLCTETHVCPVSSKVIELCSLCNSCDCECVCFEWVCDDCKNESKCFFCDRDEHYNNGIIEENSVPEACVNYSFSSNGLMMQFLFQFGESLLSFETPSPIDLHLHGYSRLKLISMRQDPLLSSNQSIDSDDLSSDCNDEDDESSSV